MANVIPKEVKKEIVDGWLAEAVWRVCLLTNAFDPLTDLYSTYTELKASLHEVVGTGYTAGGEILTRSAWGAGSGYVDTTNANLDAADRAWTTATFSNVQYVAVYCVATDKVRALYDLGSHYSVTSGTFTIQWNGGGLIKVSSV